MDTRAEAGAGSEGREGSGLEDDERYEGLGFEEGDGCKPRSQGSGGTQTQATV